MKRRTFITNNIKSAAGLVFLPINSLLLSSFKLHKKFTSKRPLEKNRTYTSTAVEEKMEEVKRKISDPEVAWMFSNCYPNTLDTTVNFEIKEGKPDTFIVTGDIDAMWLRDSTAQVWPYIPLINKDKKIKTLILGLINRQTQCVLIDPYANAFYKDLNRKSKWSSDVPNPKPGVHERKWEVDSLCYVIRLSYHYYKHSGDHSFVDDHWDKAMRLIVNTFRIEQRKDGNSPYRFAREGWSMIDAPVFNGTGRPFKPTGMICSMFRPSDDATLYPFLVPSNIFAEISLHQLAEMYRVIVGDHDFANECHDFAKEIQEGITKHALKKHKNFGKIYAYEVDGYGNALFMDDANVPSLVSLSYLGVHKETDKIYRNTRAFVISDSNPYFLRGKYAEGQASPHTEKEKIWPMGIILRGITSSNDDEIFHCIKMLKNTHAGTGFMHEAFHKDDPTNYNRSWFAWANTLFGEFIIKVYHEKPHLLEKNF